MFKSGFVSIVGRPNVGKSTFLNHVLKTKVAITSNVAQTTRTTLQGIYTDENAQIIFIDTPGIHKPQDRLGSFMNTTAFNSVFGADIVLFMAPGDERIGPGDEYILNRLKEAQKEMEFPVYLVLTKVDLLEKDQIMARLTEWAGKYPFKEIVPISSTADFQVQELLEIMKNDLPEGMQYYDENMITDHPERFMAAEYIREKILYFTNEEIPHSVAIVIDQYTERENEVDIMASIVCLRNSQKSILIGKQGSMIKKIRVAASKDIRKLLNKKVNLELYVKVEKDWRNKASYLKEIGYNEDEY